MNTKNPYLSLFEKNTDDELFEIIENPNDSDTLIFEAAVTIARKRELLSEYQATGLLEGDTSVMDYNPNILYEQDIPYAEKNKPHRDFVPKDVRFRRYGIYMIVIGTLLIFLTYKVSDWHFWLSTYMRYILAGIAIVFGLVSVVISEVIKNRDSK